MYFIKILFVALMFTGLQCRTVIMTAELKNTQTHTHTHTDKNTQMQTLQSLKQQHKCTYA